MRSKHPKDKVYIYLFGRLNVDPFESIKTGRSLVRKHPRFEYGYRLLLTSYQQHLFKTPGPDHPTAQNLLKEFKKDRKYFETYLRKFPHNDNAMYLSLELLVWEKKVNDANRLLAKALQIEPTWLNWQFYTNYYLKTDQLPLLQAYIRRAVETSTLTQSMTPDEKERQVVLAYLTTLAVGETYRPIVEYADTYPQILGDNEVQKLYLIACAQSGEANKAYSLMDEILTRSNDLYQWLANDDDVSALRQDPRWISRVDKFRQYWDSGKDNRRLDTLAKKFSRPAPQWELQDNQGNLIKLEDQKGSIVILDFWATWCEPCKMVMPVLNEWMRTRMPAGVKVFSINVWENDPRGVADFMLKNKYQMTLLYGHDNLSKLYNFTGIPYLCVIDKEGNIRFDESGYSLDLGEKLSFWVEDLN